MLELDTSDTTCSTALVSCLANLKLDTLGKVCQDKEILSVFGRDLRGDKDVIVIKDNSANTV